MGLGKTLSVISLILQKKYARSEIDDKIRDRIVHGEFSYNGQCNLFKIPGSRLTKSSTTLIVAPASVIMQWEKEIKERVKPGQLTYHIYHGADRNKSIAQ
jgi:SNF2 family DNA or RNA helicase